LFSGIQPSGELHLGNYLGAVRNWVALQGQYRCFYCIVDYHAITQPYEPVEMAARDARRWRSTSSRAASIRIARRCSSSRPCPSTPSWRGCLRPSTPHGELERMTQFKDKAERHPENINAGLFMYSGAAGRRHPALRRDRVPVGEDQRQHLELAREIVRRFNARFGETFAEPQPLFSTTPKILGLDGQAKMSKSLGNTIALREPTTRSGTSCAPRPPIPARVKRTDPGTPEKCNIYTLHKFFSDERARRGAHAAARPPGSAASTARRCCSRA
jgi:tryptophanyl-tRNA synthetase